MELEIETPFADEIPNANGPRMGRWTYADMRLSSTGVGRQFYLADSTTPHRIRNLLFFPRLRMFRFRNNVTCLAPE